MQNREHGRMKLESVENGLLIWPTVEENGVTRTKKYAELYAAEKIQADCDIKATNIILQGLPSDIYSLERECKLYDAFDKFTHIKGETLHKYYLRFTQLINDTNIYNMKIEQFQVKTKFLKSLPPKWSKFVTNVKLVKDFHTTNFDQLHGYLKQYELHANEVRLLRERNQDPLAFVGNQQMTPPYFNTYQSSYNNPQLQQQFSPSQFGSIHPNQHYSSTYPLQPQFNHSSVPSSYLYQSQMNHQTSSVPQIAYQSPQVTTQPMIELPLMDSGFAVLVLSLGDDPIACLNKAMAFLTVVASSRFPSTNNQLRASSNPRNEATIHDGRVTVQQVQGRQGQSYSGIRYKSNATSSEGNNETGQARIVKCYNCQGEGHMARQCTQPKRIRNVAWYKEKAMLAEAQEVRQNLDEEQLAFLADPGVPDAVLMDNISNYGSDVISEVPHSETYFNDMVNQGVQAMQDFEQPPAEKANKEQNNESATAELEKYKERIKTFEQRLNIHLSSREKMIDSQIDDMIREKLALKEQVDSLEQNLSKQIQEKECLLQTFIVFKSESKEKEDKYIGNEIDLEKKIKELDNILFKVGQSAQAVHLLTKPRAFYDNIHKQALGYQNPFHLKKAQRIKPTLYDGIVMSDKHVAMHFDSVVKKRTTLDARTKDLLNEIMEVQTVFNQMDVVVQQFSVDKQCLEIAKKELFLENDRLLQQIMSQDVLLTVINSMSLIGEIVNMDGNRKESCNLEAELLKSQNAFNDLLKRHSQLKKHSQLQDKDSTICKLKDIIKSMREKSKEENAKYDYCEIGTKNVELENSVAKLLSENEHLYTCPNVVKLNEKKVAVTPKNKVKKARFTEPLTSSSNNKQVESSKSSDSNTPVLSSTGLKCSTSKCGSKPTGNKRNDRISQTPSRNMKNKVEAQPKKVNKKNRVVEPICDDNIKHPK
ncbi:integrase, catalytic region, zinc finger, CCHC-type containing protein [Tanacetum coccineum]|uniref:Integrase, catalytic region, zinc finger, CCHC-type containing protein n=1 Tax=Tanacetum coccineum TaxID=301880 RepID=A0ABQ4WI54_9ASTR